MTRLSALIIVAVQTSLVACGGGEAVQGPAPPPPPPPPPDLSFQSIAGEWAGWATEGGDVWFWVRAQLGSSARRGDQVGTVEYGLGSPQNEPECGGGWFASSAEDPVFVVLERITFGGTCPDGTVRLVLDVETGILDYEFTPDGGFADATGALTRGTDPGPQP